MAAAPNVRVWIALGRQAQADFTLVLIFGRKPLPSHGEDHFHRDIGIGKEFSHVHPLHRNNRILQCVDGTAEINL